jgi:hypothetical protein
MFTQNALEVSFTDTLLEKLKKSLPPVFARKDIPKFGGKCLSVGTLANLGKNGPPYIRNARHAIYEKESFLKWFRARIT